MKKYISIIIFVIFASNITFSQNNPYHQKNNTKSGTVVALFAGSIMLNAVGNGLISNNHKPLGYVCNGLSLASIGAVPFLTDVNKKKWYIYAISYATLRISLYEPINNTIKGLSVNSINANRFSDRFWNSTKQKPDVFTRVVFFTIGVSIPLNEL